VGSPSAECDAPHSDSGDVRREFLAHLVTPRTWCPRVGIDFHDDTRAVGVVDIFVEGKAAQPEREARSSELVDPHTNAHSSDADDGTQVFDVVRPHQVELVCVALYVEGAAPAPVKLKVDSAMTKRVDGYTVTINTNGPITAGDEVVISYNLAHDRKPVTDLDLYLGALGHLIFISSDLEHYVHSHPLGAEHDTAAHQDEERGVGRHREHDEHGGVAQSARSSLVSFHALFPEAGLYKGWAQFQHQGRVITVPWVVDVKPSDNHDEHGKRDRRAGHDH